MTSVLLLYKLDLIPWDGGRRIEWNDMHSLMKGAGAAFFFSVHIIFSVHILFSVRTEKMTSTCYYLMWI